MFNNHIQIYQQALKNNGVNNNNLIYRQSQHPEKKKQKKRKCKIIWFNPPFLTNIKKNIGKIFFKLLHEHL